MKKKNTIFNYSVILMLMLFMFVSLTGCDTTTSTTKKNTGKGGGDSETGNELPGTYFGVNGSILILLPNGDAEYFYTGWDELQHDNSWSYDSDDDKLYISMKENALFGSYEVEAFINGDISSFNLVASEGTLNQSKWDDEMYYRYQDEADSYTASQCETMIKDFVKENPDIETHIPEPTKAPKATKQTTAFTAPTATTAAPSNKAEYDFPAYFTYSEVLEFAIGGDYTDSLPYYDAKSGYEYLFVKATCNNNGSSSYFLSDMYFQCYADNKLCDTCVIIADGYESSADISAGRSADIYMAFLVPKDAGTIEIEFEPDMFSSAKAIIHVK